MASSDNLASFDSWLLRPTLADSWISEAIARDTETLTKALHKSLSNHADAVAAATAAADAAISPFFNLVNPESPAATQQTQAQSASSSDLETVAAKGRNAIPVNGKPTKRKSRASKRTTTTFIAADPANFRQMVQQVTGVRFGGNGQLPVAPLLKPEPQRAVNRMQGCLPTLDTSAFLLDHHQEVVGPTAAEMAAAIQPSLSSISSSGLVGEGGAALDLDSFSSGFPTLESWKVL